MFTRAEIKQQAKDQLKGNVWILFLCTLLTSLISGAAGAIPAIGFLSAFLLAPPLTLGLTMIYLNTTYGDKPQVATIFDGFQHYGQIVLLNFMVMLFTILWSLLFVIPGIIKGLSYSMSTYILAENPDMSASEALDESKAIMDGHKMDLFVLSLSFIPWMLLCTITLGIAGIYVGPYMTLTMTNFYHKIKRTTPAVDVVNDAANADVYQEAEVVNNVVEDVVENTDNTQM